jgi:hypothetical protein
VDQKGWRDYSTYFFAALAGHKRDGSPLDRDPDLDHDGRVSPLEAHYYTLAAADSADIPRATSEALLEGWKPWYLGLTDLPEAQNTPYARLAQALERATGVEGETALRRREGVLEAEQRRLEQTQVQVKEQTDRLREAMEQELLRRWPALGEAYTLNYKHFLEQDLDAAQSFILADPRYVTLKALQDRYFDLDNRLLLNERARTRLEKIEHLQRLARVRAALDRLGPEDLRERYKQLLECESAPF